MDKRIIIGVSGLKESGKDTFGKYISDKYSLKILQFSTPLKECLKASFGLEEEEVNGIKKEDYNEFWGYTNRKILQTIGTEVFREFLPKVLDKIKPGEFWVKLMEKKINETKDNIIITDVRFENEVELIKKYGGKVYFIKRDKCKNNDNHISENININYDVSITNNGSLEDFYKKIEQLNIK